MHRAAAHVARHTLATRSAPSPLVGGAFMLGAARRVARPSTRLASSNSFELEGTITKIGDVQKFDSGFEKIEFVPPRRRRTRTRRTSNLNC